MHLKSTGIKSVYPQLKNRLFGTDCQDCRSSVTYIEHLCRLIGVRRVSISGESANFKENHFVDEFSILLMCGGPY
jgi:hypothetical protein